MGKARKPTDAELAILRCSGTAARAPSANTTTLAGGRSVGYTTTLKTLQVMLRKGLTLREDHRSLHLYRARHREQETLRRLVLDLVDRAFGGSTSKLVIQALSSRRASPDDLREIRRLLK
jgi:predicted transcriptional regulator